MLQNIGMRQYHLLIYADILTTLPYAGKSP